mmetsp:Transcript_27258/g.68707  ORF Transcript_27258/g.68707 Transcript_27258/m.68707 type:complete len:91 (+) Transcript_27258:79-351(+)
MLTRSSQARHLMMAAGAGAISAYWIFMPALEGIKQNNIRLKERQGRLDDLQAQWEKGTLTFKEMDEASAKVRVEYSDIETIRHKPAPRPT